MLISEPTYARQILAEKGIRLYAGKERILLPVDSTYPNYEDNIGFWVGEDYKKELLERKTQKINSIVKLRELGFVIKSAKVTSKEKLSKTQKVKYILKRAETETKYLQSMPYAHYVLYDSANNQIKLEGKSVLVSNWIYVKKQREITNYKSPSIYDIMDNKSNVLRKYKHNVMGTVSKEFIKITDLPIMINESNEIVCIPQQNDEPRILILGTSGFGKTYTLHGMVDRATIHSNIRIANLNDSQVETKEWALPNTDMEIELRGLNEKPYPLPAVYLTPSTDDDVEPVYDYDGIGYKITLPYNEIITNAYKYFDTRGSSKYFEPIKNKILECRDIDEIMGLFASNEPKPPLNSINMVRAIMNDLYARKIIDRWTGIHSKWAVYIKGKLIGKYNPILASLITGCVPMLQTSTIQSKNYFKPYFQYFAEDLFNKQNTDEYLINNDIRIWIMLDEFLDIMNLPIIDIIQRRGRLRRIGTIVSTQYYDKIPIGIKANINYLICFNALEAKQICRDFKIDRIYGDRIKDFNKFEMLVHTKDEFAVYDREGNRRLDKGPFIGKSLHPLSLHKAPKKKKTKKRK